MSCENHKNFLFVKTKIIVPMTLLHLFLLIKNDNFIQSSVSHFTVITWLGWLVLPIQIYQTSHDSRQQMHLFCYVSKTEQGAGPTRCSELLKLTETTDGFDLCIFNLMRSFGFIFILNLRQF